MNNTIEKTIGELVAEDYRTAQVFKNHKIDFCCKGNRTLSEVVTTKGITLETCWKIFKLCKILKKRISRTLRLGHWTYLSIISRKNTTAMWSSKSPS